MSSRWLGPLILASAAVLTGCASDHAALVARLETCGLLSEGRVGARTLSSIYAPSSCYDLCLAEASCHELEQALCRSSVSLLVRCDERCAFRCEDGGLLGPERVCDGSPQCMGGEDEQGCEFPLVCRDGRRVPGARCDGAWNCGDGSDEEGCTLETCDSGRGIGPWERCDGYLNCADGADERGCPTHTCEDGRAVTYRSGSEHPVCNGWTQCGDGSDEHDCAQLMFMCGG